MSVVRVQTLSVRMRVRQEVSGEVGADQGKSVRCEVSGVCECGEVGAEKEEGVVAVVVV